MLRTMLSILTLCAVMAPPGEVVASQAAGRSATEPESPDPAGT